MNSEDYVLYAITDQTWVGDMSLEDQVESALKGGATIIQLREKNLSKADVKKLALKLKPICEKYNAPLIINDYIDVAIEIEADGVHVGQSDTQTLEARSKIGPDKLLGVSCKTVDEALEAQRQGADYLGVGAVFQTDTKSDAETVSMDTLKDIIAAIDIPVIAIGGITHENITQLDNLGIAGVAVISAIFAQKDIKQATRSLKEKIQTIL